MLRSSRAVRPACAALLVLACGKGASPTAEDRQAPQTMIDDGPADPSGEAQPRFSFSADEEATFECRAGDSSWSPCSAPYRLPTVASGSNSFEVRAIDRAGNADPTPARWTWQVIFGPTPVLLYGPPAVSPLSTARVAVAAADPAATFRCRLDGADWAPCEATLTLRDLAPGPHRLEIVATRDADAGSGALPLVVAWTVSTAARSYRQVAVGQQHGCAIDADAGLWCFGANDFGQLGLGDTAARELPTRLGEASWASVTCGRFHTCAIRDDGSLWCWGASALGQAGSGDREHQLTPARVGLDWSMVEAGDWHTCAIAGDATLWCWGFHAFGRLGDGSAEDALRPVPVDRGHGYRAVSAGSAHSCAIREDRTLWCWGLNAQGQLGHASVDSCTVGRSDAPCSLLPRSTSAVGDWLNVTAGAEHSCGLRGDKQSACWGDGADGQLGLGSAVGRAVTPAELGDQWSEVAAGGFHSCGLRDDGTLWCWGRHASGQLGVGGLASEAFEPLQTGFESAWEEVAAGASASCGLRQGGTLWCWGQLGPFGAALPTYRPEAADR